MHFVFKSNYLTEKDKQEFFGCTNPLLEHLDKARLHLSDYNFTWIRNFDTNWSHQTKIPAGLSTAMLACLFHYDLDVSLLMRYLGNNYTAAHRDVEAIVAIISPHVDDDLVQHFVRVMTVGCPNHFVAESTRENSLRYWRGGNNPSIKKKLAQVMKTMNKEQRNNFVIPLPMWLWRFIPHIHYTPNHLLEKDNKKDRQIFDAAFRHDANSIPINKMTSTAQGTELDCQFGDALLRLLQRIWRLRISYPLRDIVVHANHVKSCF